MGPTMRVRAGQSLWIKLVNNLFDDEATSGGKPIGGAAAARVPASDTIGPKPVTAENYWKMVERPGEKIKYQYYKQPVADPSLMTVDEPNIPHSRRHTTSTRIAWPFQRWSLSV